MCDDTIIKASLYFTNGECNLRTFNVAETVENFLMISVLVGWLQQHSMPKWTAPSSSVSSFSVD